MARAICTCGLISMCFSLLIYKIEIIELLRKYMQTIKLVPDTSNSFKKLSYVYCYNCHTQLPPALHRVLQCFLECHYLKTALPNLGLHVACCPGREVIRNIEWRHHSTLNTSWCLCLMRGRKINNERSGGRGEWKWQGLLGLETWSLFLSWTSRPFT